MKVVFQASLFRCYVSFRECIHVYIDETCLPGFVVLLVNFDEDPTSIDSQQKEWACLVR